uniref:Sodium/hydrogen exchanger n=1 Tax=Schmidtea mediterranea TaxID=79327 RepID=A0A0H3YEZ0_SCHMD|nr:slc9a-1 [Schmidtea mediterranea]
MIAIFIVLMVFGCVHCSSDHNSTTIQVAQWDVKETGKYIVFSLFIFFVSLGKLCYMKFKFISAYIPESFLLILLGILTGFICHEVELDVSVKLTPELFFLILLPPIVLDSAYQMYNRTFGNILGIVLIFAVFGTILSFAIIGMSLFGLQKLNNNFLPDVNDKLMAILLFSSFIVAVDPVAVLAIFKDLKVDKELYYMIFGESLLNDAVTIVLYDIIKELMIIGDTNVKNISLGFVSFFTVSLGGLLVGVITGVLSVLLTRFQSKREIHCVMIIATAYLSYIIAYSIHWSGIMSIIGCGIVQAAYGFRNIEKSMQLTVRNFVELTAGVSESIIFVYLGIEFFKVEKVFDHIEFQISAFFLCLIARFIVIFVLRLLINFAKVDQRKISWTEMFIAAYGGLRGAVAFSLATLIIPEIVWKGDTENRKEMKMLFVKTTLMIIILTVAVMGTTIKPLAKLLKVKSEEKKILSVYNELNNAVIENLTATLEGIIDQKGRNSYLIQLANFDNLYIRPWLVNEPCDNKVFKILKRLEQVSLALHYANLDGEYAQRKLTNIPKGLWPKLKENEQDERSIDNKVIELIRKTSKSVKKAASMNLEPKKQQYIDTLEKNFNNRLTNVIRRRQTCCQMTQKVELPSTIFSLIPFENNWKTIFENEEFQENPMALKRVVASFRVNKGFLADEYDIEMSEKNKTDK